MAHLKLDMHCCAKEVMPGNRRKFVGYLVLITRHVEMDQSSVQYFTWQRSKADFVTLNTKQSPRCGPLI